MDNDDTDFQSQNFQLAGEDNSKFPSGLRPFALPKLDIDDQLQGHLRFDSLIDSEGFFSVQGNNNSWIEVLSTGSSVVDFSSSAAESCSISRTNNVWSEATSAESVEMLLKSVGENEMTGNMDGNAHHQLSGMDSQIDPSNMQPKSSSSPGSIVVPTENDQSQSTCSRLTEDPSRTQTQREHIEPFSMDEKAEQAVGSALSDRKSNYMLESVAEKCIVSEKLSSASKNTSESCPAVGNYFEVVHDDDSLDNHNVHSAGVDSEPFSELAPLQNIYATESYHFEQDNQESGVVVTPQDSEIHHMNENKVEGGLHELQNLSCTSQPLGTTNFSGEASNENLLSESSDGLLEAITNPVKMLHRNDDTFQRASATLQSSFSQVEHAAEGLKSSVDRGSEPVVKEVDTGEEPSSAKFHQSEPDSRNSNSHLVTPLSTASGELIQSPKGKQLAHVTGVPEEAKNAGVDDTNISTGDDSSLHQDSVDNLNSSVMEEKTIREGISVVSDNTEHTVKGGHDENATGATDTSKDKFDSSGNISPDNSSACLLDEKDPGISSVNHEGSFKAGATPALEDEAGNQLLVSPNSGPQEEKPVPLNISSSNIVSTTVTNTFNTSKDKLDSSGGFAPNASPAGLLVEKDLRIFSINHEGSFKEGANCALEVGGHNVTSPVSEPQGMKPAASVNSNINAVCSSGTDAVATKTQYKEQDTTLGRDTSLGGLTTSETHDKSGFGFKTDNVGIHSGDHPDAYPQKCQTDGPSMQSEHHKDLVAPSSALIVSHDKAVQKIVETPLNAKDDLNAHLQDKVLNPGADHTPGTVSFQSRVGLEPGNGDGSCTDATCSSPTVISCTEPCPLEDGQGGNALLHHTLTEQSEDPKDPAASADTAQSSQECSARDRKPTLSSEEINTTGDDRSFSFEVGAPPNVSEKAHSPAWSPFPRSKAAQSTEASTAIPIPGNPSGSPLKNNSDDSKKMSIVETGKEQLSGRKVIESAGGPSVGSHIGDSTKTKRAPLEQSQQHPTPESPVSPAALVHQPFTDLQHVQLRAQIFVYGALIQGIPPAEAYMVSAFGEPVGCGKPAWEAIWRAAVERFQNQKSPLIGLETPTSSHIGSRVAEKASKGTTIKTAPASKKGGKSVLPAHSAVPLHSPTFNMSHLGSSTLNLQRGTHLDFSQAVSPVFTYNSQTRQPASGVAPWFPQSPGPRPAPWLVPPQNLIFDSSMQPAVPTNETAKGISSKNISISQAVSPGVFLPSQAPSTVSPPLTVLHEEKQKTPASTSKRGATSQKPRKRKKVSASPEQQPGIASPQLTTDIASVTPATKHTPGLTLSTHSPSNVLGSGLVPNTGLIASVPNCQITGSKDAEPRFIFSEQICGAIEQSMAQAKGAGMHSMEALRHNEGVWSHLSTNSSSKLPAEVEEKLTSAAAAASAAVSVAKAAAEAAKMASEAALQAKLMAEEALSSSKSVNTLQKHDAGEFVVNSNPASVSSLTPTSSWKIKDNTHVPGSIISVAREVARKRVEEAAAAAKRAENLDSILKAAELAAEAVFKAGTIIGMGGPLPFTLSELLEAGPDGYWKSDRVSNKVGNTIDNNPVKEQLEVPADFSKSGRKCGSKAKYDQAIQNPEPSSSGKELQPDGMQSGNGVEDVPTTAALNGNRNDAAPSIIWNGIEKGSPVEVLADEGEFGIAWFSAKVLDINEDSAHISYDTSSEGTALRKEWVPLKQEGEKAPRIRLAHPATMSKFKGTRKRRRDTAGNYSWTIGDHVDAWIKDSWREGIISQNCDADETKFVVKFSAGGGDSLVVDAWHLRPSLVWKDGQWTEWSRVQERKAKSNKGDSPYEKRQRTTGSDPVPIGGEAGGSSKDKSTNNSTKPEELRPLALSDRDMVFNIGKSVTENDTHGLAFKRPGLQKEGSRVVYGVPKPGKKKKFMEVSKHYDEDQADKISEGNASTRPTKHLMPQVPRPRESTSKVEQRGKRIGEMRSRGLKYTKSQNVASNSVTGKDPLSMSVPSSGVFESSFAFVGSAAGSSNTVNPTVEKNNSTHGTGLGTEDASVSGLHTQAASTVPTSRKNLTTTDRAKRKYVPSMDNLNRNILKTSEIAGKISSDSSEPRRSNRRIQPTSRLLEGLQSSLIVSKVPGEKGPRTNYRSASSSGRALG